MLSVAHLLDALDHLDHFEKKVVQAGNQGMTGPSPTWTTWTTEKQGMHDETDGAERPLSFEPLPGRYFIDPVEHGYLVACKVMADLSECRGYPQACPRCRLLMADLKTCLLGPEAEHVATASQEPAATPKAQSRANGRKNSQSPAAGRTERKTEGLK